MAFTDVINTDGSLFQVYPELITFIGDANGDPPVDNNPPTTVPDSFPNGHTTRVVQSAGGARLDFAEIKNVLTASLENRSQPADFTRMVGVHIPSPAETRIHLGDLVTETVSVDGSGEKLTTQSQLRPYHFGDPVEGYKVHDPVSDSQVVIEDDIVFNPIVDDAVIFNMSSKTGTPSIPSNVWTHPELADNAAGEAFQDQTRSEWDLEEAVAAMCDLLNPNEDFIDRPTFYGDLSTAPPIRNLEIKMGQRLPQVLDKMLVPHGY